MDKGEHHQERFPDISEPERTDICFATTNRQRAVRDLAEQTDLILVVGSRNSSNSNRLREVATHRGVPAFLIDDAGEIDPDWLHNVQHIGVTAGASAPEHLVDEVALRLREYGATEVTEMEGERETVSFQLPKLPVPFIFT